eukprot:4023178-Prymnesium_polylepis.1
MCVSPPCTAPSRRLCVHRAALAPTCRADVRVPTCWHPRVHPKTFCVAQLRHVARSDYNSMDEWGECHAGERYRWQRALARVGCLSP